MTYSPPPGYYGVPQGSGQVPFAYAGYGGPPPPRRSRVVPIVLVSAGIALVLVLGGFVALALAGQNQKDKAVVVAQTVSINAPDALLGLARNDDPQYDVAIESTERALATYPNAAGGFAAFYGSGDQAGGQILAFATKALIVDQDKGLDSLFQNFGQDLSPPTGLHDVDAGALGGVAQCGVSKLFKGEVTVCGWADDGSLGALVEAIRPDFNMVARFTDLRAQIETKAGVANPPRREPS